MTEYYLREITGKVTVANINSFISHLETILGSLRDEALEERRELKKSNGKLCGQVLTLEEKVGELEQQMAALLDHLDLEYRDVKEMRKKGEKK